MEMLTYSLWFTLVWWWISIILTHRLSKEHDGAVNGNDILLVLFVIIPSIAILLEYLMVR